MGTKNHPPIIKILDTQSKSALPLKMLYKIIISAAAGVSLWLTASASDRLS